MVTVSNGMNEGLRSIITPGAKLTMGWIDGCYLAIRRENVVSKNFELGREFEFSNEPPKKSVRTKLHLPQNKPRIS